MTVRELADGQFAVGQAVGDVTGYIAKITNPEMIAIQPENGMGKKITLFACEKGKGVGQSAHAGQLMTFVGLTARPAYVGHKPASAGGGSYTQNQFNFQSCFPADSAPASPAQPGQPSPAKANGNGKDEARIERQSARRDTAIIVSALIHALGRIPTAQEMADMVNGTYHEMLKLTGTEALPAKAEAQPESKTEMFLDAVLAGEKLKKLLGGDAQAVRHAWKNLTGFETRGDVPDLATAKTILTAVGRVEELYAKCSDEDKPSFAAHLAMANADRDTLEATLRGLAEASQAKDDIPF